MRKGEVPRLSGGGVETVTGASLGLITPIIETGFPTQLPDVHLRPCRLLLLVSLVTESFFLTNKISPIKFSVTYAPQKIQNWRLESFKQYFNNCIKIFHSIPLTISSRSTVVTQRLAAIKLAYMQIFKILKCYYNGPSNKDHVKKHIIAIGIGPTAYFRFKQSNIEIV